MLERIRAFFTGEDSGDEDGGPSVRPRIRATGGGEGHCGIFAEERIEVWQGGEKVGVERLKRRRAWLPGVGSWKG